MVTSQTLVAMVFTIAMSALSIIIPFVLVYILTRTKEVGMWGSLGLGVLAYFWSQYLLSLPVLFILGKFQWFMDMNEKRDSSMGYLFTTALLLAVLASFGRIWCIWLMNKRTPSFYRAVCSGIGFAAFRSLSVATSYYSYHGYSKAVNSEGVEALTERLLGTGIGLTESDVNNMISQLTGANNFDVAMEGINAFLLVIIEIAIMVLVYEGFVRKKMWLGTLVSCGVAFTFSFLSMIIGRTAGNIIYDAYVLICALASAWVIWQVFKRYQEALKVGLYTETVYFEKTEEDRMKDLL